MSADACVPSEDQNGIHMATQVESGLMLKFKIVTVTVVWVLLWTIISVANGQRGAGREMIIGGQQEWNFEVGAAGQEVWKFKLNPEGGLFWTITGEQSTDSTSQQLMDRLLRLCPQCAQIPRSQPSVAAPSRSIVLPLEAYICPNGSGWDRQSYSCRQFCDN